MVQWGLKPKNKTEEEPKPEPTKAKTKRKKSPFELHKKFRNEIKNDKKNKNEHIFKEHFFIILRYFLKRWESDFKETW